MANDRESELYELFPEVVQAIMNPDAKILWRFVREGDDILAVPYSEAEVVWIDKRPANDKT